MGACGAGSRDQDHQTHPGVVARQHDTPGVGVQHRGAATRDQVTRRYQSSAGEGQTEGASKAKLGLPRGAPSSLPLAGGQGVNAGAADVAESGQEGPTLNWG
jgi:hypothetical protein